jgi:Protein of unknown function, DUF481
LRRYITLTAVLCVATASLLADQIVMKNGDRVTGSIIKKDAATLTIKTVNFGTVTLPWDQIDSVKTDAPLTVVLPNAKSVEGTIATTDSKQIEVDEKSTKETVAPKDVIALRNADEQKAYLRLLHPGFKDLWIVAGGVNLAGTTGNSETASFTIPVTFTRASNSSKTTAYFNFIHASASVDGKSSETASAVRGGWSYSHNLHPKIFATVFNDYEYDKFQSLDLRAVFGGGLGWHAWKSDRGFLDVVGGADYNRSKFGPPAPAPAYTQSFAEAYFGDDFGYKLNKKLSFKEGYRMFLNLSDTGNYRQNFDVSLAAVLAKGLTWNASLSDRYLSNPVAGNKKNDFLYSTGFGFTFAK